MVTRQPDDPRQEGDQRDNAVGGGGAGGGPREGDLDVMSATSSALGQVHTSASNSSQRERRAQIDSCWCNIPDMFVDPASRAAYYWMALVTVAVVYNWIVIILRVAFEDMRDSEFNQKAFRVLDMISDVIYLMDVAIQSRTAYLEDGCLVKSLPETVRHYRSQSYFALDVLSVVPVTALLSHLSTTPGLRILRLLKYPSMTRFFEKTDSRTNNPNLLRAFRLSLHLWLVIHWISCFYYLLSQYEGLGTNDWVYPNTTEYSAFSRKYIFCMYWSTMTLTTIGERPWPATDVEYIFTGMTFLIGVFVFAAVVGNVGDVISNMNAARHDFQARMDQIKFYLNQRNVPEHLQDQIKRWAEYTWARTKAIDERSVLQLLPSRLRTEVAIHVHLKTLKKVRIFEQCEEGLLRELVLKLRPSIYSPGEYICRIGEIGREMYIIDHGKVEILFPERGSGQMKQVAVMMPGNYFGEISLLKLDEGQNRRTADVRSIGFSELLCLSRRDLMAALMEYPEAKKIFEAQARQRMQQTKRSSSVAEPDVPHDSANPETSSVLPGSGSGRRSARAVFAQVMRQQGFSRLLADTAKEELTEMRKILGELKEIKGQGRKMEQRLLKDEDLEQIHTQLLQHTGALITSSNHTSPSNSTVTNHADLSSDTSTLTSPAVSLTASGTASSSPRDLALAMKTSVQYTSYGREVFPGVMSTQSKHSAKAVRPFGCSVLPQGIANAVRVLPACKPETIRQRRSPSSRVPKYVDKDHCQLKMSDRAGKAVQDSNTALNAAQGGGGDEPAMAPVDKDPPDKDFDEERKGGMSVKKSASSTDSCKGVPSAVTSLGSAVGSQSSFEFSTPISIISLEKQYGPKLTALGASSEQLRPLAPSDSNTSSYTTDASTTSSSSGGRGHTPKPAKPRPRYRTEELAESSSQITTNKEKSARCLEETPHKESEICTTTVKHFKDIESKTPENYVSSEGFSAVSISISLDSDDSTKSTDGRACFSTPLTGSTVIEQKCMSMKSKQQKHDLDPQQQNIQSEKAECIANKTDHVVNLSEPDKLSLSPNCTVGSTEQTQEHLFPRTNSFVEEQTSSDREGDLGEQGRTSVNSILADQSENDSTILTVADVSERSSFPPVADDGQEDASGHSDDSDTNSKGNFIAATRVKSDFDKRISRKDLADVPRTVTCRKIDDTQLSILLAKRREVNDSADYTVESPDRPKVSSVNMGKSEESHSEHSHSVHSVIKNPTKTSCAHESTQSAEKLMPDNQKQTSDETAGGKDMHQICGEGKPPATLMGSVFTSENRSHYAKAEVSAIPVLSTDLHWQIDSAHQDVVYNENLLTEHIDCIRSDESKILEQVSKDSQCECNEELTSFNKQPIHCIEDEDKVNTDGMNHSETEVEMHVKSRVKEKTYPISILKKGRSDKHPVSQHDNSNTQVAHQLACPEISSQFEGTMPPTTSIAGGSAAPPLPLDTRNSLDTNTPVEDGTTLPTKNANDDKLCTVKGSDSEMPLVENESASFSTNFKKHSNKAQRRARNRNVALQQDLCLFKCRNVLGQDTSVVQPASTECTSKSNSVDMTYHTRDQSLLLPSTETIAQTTEDEKETENLSTLRRQYSASLYRRRSLDNTGESADNSSLCSGPVSVSPLLKEETSADGTSRLSDMVSGNQSPSGRRHSEKLDWLVTSFDNGMKRQVKEESRQVVSKNSTINYSETNTLSHPETETVSKQPSSVEKDKVELTEKEKLNDSVGDSTSPEKSCSPVPSSLGIEEESKRGDTLLLTSSLTASPPQKRKTLRRRSLTKRVSNPYCRKEGLQRGKLSAQSSEDGSDMVSSVPKAENETERATSLPEPQAEDITTRVTLVKNLVWEMDQDKRSSSASHDREGQISDSKNESPLSSQVQDSISCNSRSTEQSNPVPLQQSDQNSRLEVSPINFTSYLFFGSGEIKRDTDYCVDGHNLRSSSQMKEPDSHIAVSESNTIAHGLKEMPSTSKSMSFKDKIKEAADRLRSGETLDKANNSIMACSHYLSSSGSSSPSDSMIIRSVYGSHVPVRPSDPPPYDMSLMNPPSPFQTSPLNTGLDINHLAIGYHEIISGTEAEDIASSLQTGATGQNRNHPFSQMNNFTSVHSNTDQTQISATFEDGFERQRVPISDTLAGPNCRSHCGIVAVGRYGAESSTATCSRQCAAGFPDDRTFNTQRTEPSDHTRPSSSDPGTAEQGSSGTPNDSLQQTAEYTPEAHHLQDEHSQEVDHETGSNLLEAASHGPHVPESLVGSSMVQTLHLQPGLLDSPGASSTDDSAGEGEGEAEAMGSFILLADFGVDEDDDEGALSGLSGCNDHSDTNSDLDDL